MSAAAPRVTSGSTVYWINSETGLRKRYGKCVPQDQGPPIRFMEFTLIKNEEDPTEDKTIVAFVLDGHAPSAAGLA